MQVGIGLARGWGAAALGAVLLAVMMDPGPAHAATIPAKPAVCFPKHTPGSPVMTSFDFSPASVDVTNASKKITFTVLATDSSKDITAISIELASPQLGDESRSVDANLTLQSGTARDGSWRGSAIIPRWTIGGAWAVNAVSLRDAGGGATFYNPMLLSWNMAWPKTFDVTSMPDTKPPTVTSVTLSPKSVNTSRGTKRIKVTVKVKDDVSGLSSANGVYATGFVTIGTHFFSISGETLRRRSGTPESGTYQGGFNVPAWVRSGTHTWGLVLDLIDRAGNEIDVQSADLKAQHHTSGFNVTSKSDDTRPILRSLTFKPTSVDARNGHKNVAVTVRASDTLSGLSEVVVTFTSPSGVSSSSFASGVFGGPSTQTLKLTVPIQRCSDPGTWTVSVDLYDNAGNTKHYTTAQVKAKHLPTTLKVKALDAEPPSASIPAVISPEGSLPVTLSEPTLWKDGTAQTALQVLDDTTFDPIDGTWSCKNAAGSTVTCDADGADVRVATFAPTSALESSHKYLVQTTFPDIFDTSGNQLPTYVATFMTNDDIGAG